jgi:hypothetical protein
LLPCPDSPPDREYRTQPTMLLCSIFVATPSQLQYFSCDRNSQRTVVLGGLANKNVGFKMQFEGGMCKAILERLLCNVLNEYVRVTRIVGTTKGYVLTLCCRPTFQKLSGQTPQCVRALPGHMVGTISLYVCSPWCNNFNNAHEGCRGDV